VENSSLKLVVWNYLLEEYHKSYHWIDKGKYPRILDFIYKEEDKKIVYIKKCGYFKTDKVRRLTINFGKYDYYDKLEIIDWIISVKENRFDNHPIYIFPEEKKVEYGRNIKITFELKDLHFDYTEKDLTKGCYIYVGGLR